MSDFTTTEASMSDIRSMFGTTPATPAEAPAAKEPAAVENNSNDRPEPVLTETAPNSEAGEQEWHDEDEAPLPPGVQKRIAREVAKVAEIQKAISARKAAQAELDKLSTGKPGSVPAQSTAPVETPKPVKPQPTDSAYDDDPDQPGSGYKKFRAAEDKFFSDHEQWLIAQTEQRVASEFSKRQAQQTVQKAWTDATAKHAAEWPTRAKAIAAGTPEGLQEAISALDDWPAMVNHLGDPTQAATLKALGEKFARSPFAAAAELGRIEATLSESAKEPRATPIARKPLPDPLNTVGGRPSHSSGAVDLDKASVGTAKKAWLKMMAEPARR